MKKKILIKRRLKAKTLSVAARRKKKEKLFKSKTAEKQMVFNAIPCN